jgi:cold shock CspA family protein
VTFEPARATDPICGTVISYDGARGFGFIIGQDGRRYFFHVTDLEEAATVVGMRVAFEPDRIPATWHARRVRRVAQSAPEPFSPGWGNTAEVRLARCHPASRFPSKPWDNASATLDSVR